MNKVWDAMAALVMVGVVVVDKAAGVYLDVRDLRVKTRGGADRG